MSDLSNYRASIKRIIEAENVDEAIRTEGFGDAVSGHLRNNKAFKASRSVQSTSSNDRPATPADKMSQRQVKR